MKVGIFCRDPLVKDGLHCLLSKVREISSVDLYNSVPDVRLLTESKHDLMIATMDRVEAKDLAALEAAKRKLKIRLVVVDSESSMASVLRSFADVVVDRDLGFEGLLSAIQSIGQREPDVARHVGEPARGFGFLRVLTPREREVARLVSKGMPNRSIAKVLGIQEQSVKNLVSGVMRKMECENRTQLALQLSSSTY